MRVPSRTTLHQTYTEGPMAASIQLKMHTIARTHTHTHHTVTDFTGERVNECTMLYYSQDLKLLQLTTGNSSHVSPVMDPEKFQKTGH